MLGVLALIISKYFIDYEENTERVIFKTMFILIGIFYLLASSAWNDRINQVIFAICGVYLITMNFIPKTTLFTGIGIVCLLVPLLIAKFSKEAKQLDNS
jgi:uncharacterized membrane protein